MKMNWFQRHLNWTMVLGYLLIYAVSCLVAGIILVVDYSVSDEAAGTAGNTIGFITFLPIATWVFKQKGRSLWWLLLSWSGWVIFLDNKRTTKN